MLASFWASFKRSSKVRASSALSRFFSARCSESDGSSFLDFRPHFPGLLLALRPLLGLYLFLCLFLSRFLYHSPSRFLFRSLFHFRLLRIFPRRHPYRPCGVPRPVSARCFRKLSACRPIRPLSVRPPAGPTASTAWPRCCLAAGVALIAFFQGFRARLDRFFGIGHPFLGQVGHGLVFFHFLGDIGRLLLGLFLPFGQRFIGRSPSAIVHRLATVRSFVTVRPLEIVRPSEIDCWLAVFRLRRFFVFWRLLP